MVVVAALGRLHAAWAARLARALQDGRHRRLAQLLDHLVAALRDSDTSRVAVVDEDLRLARVRVQRRRQSSDVVAVAQREQRQQPDRRVLHRVQAARQVGPLVAYRRQRLGRDVQPQCDGVVALRRQVERLLAKRLVRRPGAPAERDHRRRDRYLPQVDRGRSDRLLREDVQHPRLADLARLRVVRDVGRPRVGRPRLHVQLRDEKILGLVEVDGARV